MNAILELPETEFIARANEQVDRLEEILVKMPQPNHETIHLFTPGLYVRQFVMPAGSIYTSKIHKTEHPFAVMTGLCSVKNVLTGEWQHIRAPFLGITKPGSRRVLVIHEETIWVTFHPTTETDLVRIEEQLIEPHEHSLALAQRRLA